MQIPAECPICLEDAERVAISRCGHYVCERCLSEMYDLRGRRGTLHNLIQTREDQRPSRCAQCRARNPFLGVRLWPPAEKNHIKIFGLLEL